ncbi:MAG: DMT family transporter [Sandaracinaceae bacterium]|nr:DMT family transporter [Sandaracinaceae bacterium]
MIEKSTVFRARATLIGLTLIWGSTFVAIQSALAYVSPFVLISIRFALTGAALALIYPRAAREAFRILAQTWPLAIAQFLGFGLQTIGMKTTTPGHSAFITSLFVVVVPVLEAVQRRAWPKKRLLFAVGLAACGIVTLFLPFNGRWTQGDTLTLVSAVSFAYYIVELSRLTQTIKAIELVIAQSISIACMAVPSAFLFETPKLILSIEFFEIVGYLTVICTMVTFIFMTRAQRFVSATEASIIYTLEPVIAAALSIGLGREAFSVQFLVGSVIVLISTLIAALTPAPVHTLAP